VAIDQQVQATENWFAAVEEFPDGNDHENWGSSADFVIGPDRRIDGEIAIVLFGDWRTTFSSWSAEFGAEGANTMSAASVGVAIEVAQPLKHHPFTNEIIDGLVWLCGHINDELGKAGVGRVPAERIAFWDRSGAAAVSGGYLGHEDLANGVGLGKSDPGPQFPWAEFIHRLGRTPPLEGGNGLAGDALAATNLFDYYRRSGVAFPSKEERALIFSALGLGYQGLPEENTDLLPQLQSRGTAPRRASDL
jgi:hypothetical protein